LFPFLKSFTKYPIISALVLNPDVPVTTNIEFNPENMDGVSAEITFLCDVQNETIGKAKVRGKGGRLEFNVHGTEKANDILL
jgi:hypothetical protein